MKKIILSLSAFFTLSAVSSTKPYCKNGLIYTKGYYVSLRADTIHGDIQTSPTDETDFYKQFSFRLGGQGKKPRTVAGQKQRRMVLHMFIAP